MGDMKECINNKCQCNNDGKCTSKTYVYGCISRTKHTPNYAEEQLEHAKEPKMYTCCYNKDCKKHFNENKCSLEQAIKCKELQKDRIDYESEYNKLKKAIEVKDKVIEKLEKENRDFKCGLEISKVRKENERLGKSTNEYYYNWVESETKVEELLKQIEKFKKEIADNNQVIETEYKNKLFLAEQEINRLNTENACLKEFKEESEKKVEYSINCIKVLAALL